MAGFYLLLEAPEPSGMFLSQVSSGTNSSVLDLASLWALLVHSIQFLLSVDFPNILEPENNFGERGEKNKTEKEEGGVVPVAEVEDMIVCRFV